MEKGDDDAVELLDEDVAGPITDLFEKQEHSASQGGSHELTLPLPSRRQVELSRHVLEEVSDQAWDIAGDTSLHNTVIYGSVEEVTRLRRDEKRNINALDQHGRSALHVAVDKAPFHMVKLLLDLGADIHFPDTEVRTPLHLASAVGNVNAIALLLEYGADTSITDKRGQSALHVATAEGSTESVRTLVLYGADTEGRDSKGNTPLDEAVARGDQTILHILNLARIWMKGDREGFYVNTTLITADANGDQGSMDIQEEIAENDKEWYMEATVSLRASQKFPPPGALDLYARLLRIEATWEKWEVAANQIPALLKLTYFGVVIFFGKNSSLKSNSETRAAKLSR
jgi:hypothetical protein